MGVVLDLSVHWARGPVVVTAMSCLLDHVPAFMALLLGWAMGVLTVLGILYVLVTRTPARRVVR